MKLPSSDYDLEHRVTYRLALLSARNTRSVLDLYRKHGLTVAAWRALSLIGHHEPIHPSNISERSSVDPDKVTRAVDALVARGYVARNGDSRDRRRVVLTLTPRGRKVYVEIEGVRRRIEERFLGVLSAAEKRQFLALLGRLEEQGRRLFTGRDAWKAIVGGGVAGESPAPARRTR